MTWVGTHETMHATRGGGVKWYYVTLLCLLLFSTYLAAADGTFTVRCTAGNTQRSYHPNNTYVDLLPLDIVDNSCSYTATSNVYPSVGTLYLTQTSNVLQYIYTIPNLSVPVHTTLGYTVWCQRKPNNDAAPMAAMHTAQQTTSSALDAMNVPPVAAPNETAALTRVCSDTLSLWVHTDTPRCPRANAMYEVDYGSVTTRALVMGYACPFNTTLNTTVTGVWINSVPNGRNVSKSDTGEVSVDKDGALIYRAPVNDGTSDNAQSNSTKKVSFELRVWCNEWSLCDTTVTFTLRPSSSAPPTPQPQPQPTTNLPRCLQRNIFRVQAGARLIDSMHVEPTYNASNPPLTCKYVVYVVATKQPYALTARETTTTHTAPYDGAAAAAAAAEDALTTDAAVRQGTRTTTDTRGAAAESDQTRLASRRPVGRLMAGLSGPRGELVMDLFGAFTYVAPMKEKMDTFAVDIYCEDTLICGTTLTLDVYTPENANRSMAPSVPVPSLSPTPCTAQQRFHANSPRTFSGTLVTGDYEELECAGGGRRLAYARRYSPSKGILTLQWNGTFTYEADPHEHEMMYEFSYDLHCLDAASSSSSSPSTEPMTPEERAVLQDSDRALCSGRVFLIVSPYWTAPTSLPAPFVNRSELTCSGSCTASPWSIYPQGPRWDGYRAVTPAGSSALTLRWSKEGDEDGVVMTLRTVLGTMGVTFPTFRVLRSRAGKFMEPEDWDVVGGSTPRGTNTNESNNLPISYGETGFDMRCLSTQPHLGVGKSMWWWPRSAAANHSPRAEGRLGPSYRGDGEASWYQKFGGMHRSCDVFADSCALAPLLTPVPSSYGRGGTDSRRAREIEEERGDDDDDAEGKSGRHAVRRGENTKSTAQAASSSLSSPSSSSSSAAAAAKEGGGGERWRVDIRDCEATWTGTFGWDALKARARRGYAYGRAATPSSDPRQTYTERVVLYAQSVQPHSWSKEGQFDSAVDRHVVQVGKRMFVSARITNLRWVYWRTRVDDDNVHRFSVETEYFTYRTHDTGDDAFGINVLLIDDRRYWRGDTANPVVEYHWTHQRWDHPDGAECPTCTPQDAWMECTTREWETFHTRWVPFSTRKYAVMPVTGYTGSYTDEQLPHNLCPTASSDSPHDSTQKRGRVVLSKGPPIVTSDTVGRTGFPQSTVYNQNTNTIPTMDCNTKYYNLTLRGVIPGSGALSPAERSRGRGGGVRVTGEVTLMVQLKSGSSYELIVNMEEYGSVISHVQENTVQLEPPMPQTTLCSSVMNLSDRVVTRDDDTTDEDELQTHVTEHKHDEGNARNDHVGCNSAKTSALDEEAAHVPDLFLSMCVLNSSRLPTSMSGATLNSSHCVDGRNSDTVNLYEAVLFTVQCGSPQCAEGVNLHRIRVMYASPVDDMEVLDKVFYRDESSSDGVKKRMYLSPSAGGGVSRHKLLHHHQSINVLWSSSPGNPEQLATDDAMYAFAFQVSEVARGVTNVFAVITLNDTSVKPHGVPPYPSVYAELRHRINVNGIAHCASRRGERTEYGANRNPVLPVLGTLIFVMFMLYIVYKIGKGVMPYSSVAATSTTGNSTSIHSFERANKSSSKYSCDDAVNVIICVDDAHSVAEVTSDSENQQNNGVTPPTLTQGMRTEKS